MKVIKKAFKQALTSKDKTVRKGWWGYNENDNYFIMRYGHTILTFDKRRAIVIECCTRSDRNGINHCKELIELWVKDEFRTKRFLE